MIKNHYSGEESIDFWERINNINGEQGATLYNFALILQDVEIRVLAELERLEKLKEKNK